MKFCTVCRKPLEFFEFLDGDQCTSCQSDPASQRLANQEKTPPIETLGSLDDTTLCIEDEKIVLQSPEGWTLWSSPLDGKSRFGDIISHAVRIHTIRSKRRNKN